MRLVLQELARLRVFGRPSQRASFLQQLTDLTEEFYAYEITPPRPCASRWRTWRAPWAISSGIIALYAAYDGKLQPRAWTPAPGSRSCRTGWRKRLSPGKATCIWMGFPI